MSDECDDHKLTKGERWECIAIGVLWSLIFFLIWQGVCMYVRIHAV